MLKKISYAIVIATVVFFILGAFLPREVHVERTLEIRRPAATVFTVLNGYRAFLSWSPWFARDPDAEYRLSGPEYGVGARLNWNGEPRRVGSGWQEIIESQPYSLLRMHLEFDQQGTAESYFHLAGRNGSTVVTWGFDTDLTASQGPFAGVLARYFGLFFDRWIGSDYDDGLLRLKRLVESMPAGDFSDLAVERIELEPMDLLYVRSDPGGESPELTGSLAAAYREITALMAEQQIERAAQPMAITHMRDGQAAMLWAAIPVVSKDLVPSGRVRVGRSPSGRAVRAVHRGAYDDLNRTYDKLLAWMAAHGLARGAVSWEHYVSDPRETAPEDVVTHIYIQVEKND